MSGSDFSITETSSVRAVFQCDGELISVKFYVGDEQAGPSMSFTRSGAVQEGKRVAETGICKGFPVSGVSLNDVKSFGTRLMLYGENGC
jgi:hypothetical protein